MRQTRTKPPRTSPSRRHKSLGSTDRGPHGAGLDAEILSAKGIVDVNASVCSDEPEEGQTGDGNDSSDAEGIRLSTLKVRKERKGDGDGRVDLIIIMATENLGRVGMECCTVTVEHDSRKHSKRRLPSRHTVPNWNAC